MPNFVCKNFVLALGRRLLGTGCPPAHWGLVVPLARCPDIDPRWGGTAVALGHNQAHPAFPAQPPQKKKRVSFVIVTVIASESAAPGPITSPSLPAVSHPA